MGTGVVHCTEGTTDTPIVYNTCLQIELEFNNIHNKGHCTTYIGSSMLLSSPCDVLVAQSGRRARKSDASRAHCYFNEDRLERIREGFVARSSETIKRRRFESVRLELVRYEAR